MPLTTKRLSLIVLVTLLHFPLAIERTAAQNSDSISDNASSPLSVGVYVHPPFVIRGEDGYGGMAVDLWQSMASELGLESTYVEFGNVGELVAATAAGDVDVAVTNMTVTKGRIERIDLTQPWFDAGQRIMVRADAGGGFRDLIAGLNNSGHLRAYAWIALVIIGSTLLLTLFDRHFDKNFPRRWRDGIAESFYTVMSVATSGKPPARKNLFGWAGRIWQGVWLVCGIAVLAYVTSSVTSVMTTLSLTSQINTVADLPGRPVGVQPGSVSEEYAREAGLNVRPFEHIEDAVAALENGRIDAIIGDAPVLEYYAHSNPQSEVSVVGPIFAPDKYAFGLTRQNVLTRPLNVELVGAHESGLLQTLRAKYFGEEG